MPQNARDPQNRLQPAPKIIPQARPVDIFHRADETLLPQGPSEVHQLTEALKDFSPSLYRTADIMHAEETQKSLSEGEQAVLADKRYQNRRDLKAAVDRGEIPAAQNPWFLQGMRQQVYRLEGERYDVALRKAYAESGSRNEEDISDFIGGFTSKYIEGIGADPSDPETARILTPLIERSNTNVIDRHRAERDHAHEVAVEDNTSQEIGLLLDRMGETPYSNQGDYAKVIHGIVQEHYQNGLDGTRSNEIVANAIRAKAEERDDTTYWEMVDQIPSGSGTIGQIAAIKEMRRASEERIYHNLEERDRAGRLQAKAQKEDDTKALLGEGFNTIVENPSADIRDVLKRLSVVDPTSAEKLYSWKQAQINGADNIVEDESTALTLSGKVFAGEGDLSEIMDANKHGLIKLDTAKKLVENIERSREFRSTLRDPTIQELHKALGGVIRGSDTLDRSPNSINAVRAQNYFLEQMNEFKKPGKDGKVPNGLETLQYGRSLQKELIDLYAGTTADEAGALIKLTPDSALQAAPESIDWVHQTIFTPEQLSSELKKYNDSQGTEGKLPALAAKLGISVDELYKSQFKLANTKPTTTK